MKDKKEKKENKMFVLNKMNQEKANLEQNSDEKVEQKPESVVQVSESQNESKRKAKLEQDRLLREERLNASGNDKLVRELQKNEISRVKPVKKRGRKQKTPPLRNEKGIKLNKDGTEDKRSANYYNGPLYKSILARKKEAVESEPSKKKVVYTPIVESDSESDAEFEIEFQPTPAPVVSQGTNDFLKKQEADREKMFSDQLKAMELENKKLKDDFHFNSHLNRISLSARSMKLKF
tara:strand:+ start:378 stop:1082 length:705 start_codon:yes stop_codon:yes gene_type:complete